MRKSLLFLTLALIAVTSLQLWAPKGLAGQKSDAAEGPGEGNPVIGGDFTLTDQKGKTVHAADFRGRLMLVYFGFTHCPDICPVTISTMSKAVEQLGTKASQVAPIFITVDPERDTPSVLKGYLANFDKHMIGLTGTPQQIKQVAANYKAYFAKRKIPWAEESPDEEEHEHHHEHGEQHHDEDYAVDHSGFIYLMGKDGKYIQHFEYNADPQDIAHAMESAL